MSLFWHEAVGGRFDTLDPKAPCHYPRNLSADSHLKLMTKRDLVIRISEDTGQAQQKVLQVVQRTLDLICEAVAAGKTVEFRNFGVFEVKVRKARIGRNPHQPGTDVPIPQRAVVKFKPGKEMREAVLKLPPPKV